MESAIFNRPLPNFFTSKNSTRLFDLAHCVVRLCHQKMSAELFWSLVESFPSAYERINPPEEDNLSAPDSLLFYRVLGEAMSSLMSMNIDVVSGVVRSLEEMRDTKARLVE